MERVQHNSDEIRQEIRRLIAEVTERSEDEVTDHAHFVEDLGMDSLMALEVMIDVEKRHKIELPESEFHKLRNLSETIELVQRTLASGSSSS